MSRVLSLRPSLYPRSLSPTNSLSLYPRFFRPANHREQPTNQEDIGETTESNRPACDLLLSLPSLFPTGEPPRRPSGSGSGPDSSVPYSFSLLASLSALPLFDSEPPRPPSGCKSGTGLSSGSLFCLLQRNTAKLDWRRRVRMALDVVSDFGLSRLKSKAYLTTKTGKGTPQWMALEVLRNEASDEKSDVYSYGVVLWEIATQKIPWDNLNAAQVIGAVGFMNQRLDIPHDVDPQWASIIENCWHSDPKCRPTF
ncbi:serine/threonine-protein kinase EDR1-like [Eucalyptus grandis]|uniref:serine/threonine-protein kinase EDR1-like n=1 Tax=Eucalyptus grandis TaxID=71139 RepID=UPI00192F07E2|nr:serine/threonine-protein kinase EDR1-like [Eucalyptus grandis]